MKTQKFILVALIQLTVTAGFAQQKNYQIDPIEKTRAFGEQVILTWEDKVDSKDTSRELEKSVVTEATEFLKFGIRIFKWINKNNIGKYEADYQGAINSLKTTGFLVLTRNILLKSGEETAVRIYLQPDVIDGKYVSFSVHHLKANYTKAKIKKNYKFVDYSIKIEASYFDGSGKKSTIESDPFSLSPYMKNKKQAGSDRFPIDGLSRITIKVVETNPFKIKLEKAQSFFEDNDELISDILDKLKGK